MAKCLSPGSYGSCRKCSACVARRQREWLLRMQLEAMLYDDDRTTFLTLTYSSDNLPPTSEDAKLQLQLWFKRLRKVFGVASVRYVSALESGSRGTKRFHWHCILYGIRFTHINRHLLDRSWGNGFIDWKPVSPGRMAYVLKYCIKGNVFLMSRRPGIGDGMIKNLNVMLSELSELELQKLRNTSELNFFVNSYFNKYLKRTRSIPSLRIGGYFYPIHRFLKERLRDIWRNVYEKE